MPTPSFRFRRQRSSGLENQGEATNPIQNIVQARAWRKFRARLASKSREEFLRDIQTPLPNRENSEGTETILHLCCQVHPPKDIVFEICAAYPEAVSLYDGLGRAPLHIATKYGASPDVIRFLLEKKRSVAKVQDSNGQTPLHLACENYAYNYKKIRKGLFRVMSHEAALRSTIKLLSLAAPEAVTLEDNEGLSALELAIESESPEKVVRDLQKVSERHWKARAKDN